MRFFLSAALGATIALLAMCLVSGSDDYED